MKGTNLNLSFGLEKIYEDASFHINDFDKVGLVGVNGAGKTTLFKVILKELEPDSGKIEIINKRVGYLPQEIIIEDKDISVFDYLLSARPIKKLNDEIIKLYTDISDKDEKEQDKIMKRISKIQSLLEYYDCYNYENILLELINNMHINPDILDSKLISLSGGQKSKVAFARVLFSKPEILLLDEPTNHLDLSTMSFITNYLSNYKGMVLIISHDVEFLNKIVNKILYINKTTHKISLYEGNYNTYKIKREKELEIQSKLIDKQEREIKELEAFIDKAKKASQTNHNLKRMGKDREIKLNKKIANLNVREKKYSLVKLNIKPNQESGKIPLKIDNLTFNYPNKELLYRNLSFMINRHERFLIVGENGVGKSTLLKLIIGKLSPIKGNISYGIKTDIAYYAQELELLDDHKTILENVDTKEYGEKELRTILGSFLFHGDDVFKKISVLSPGEKARVALCKIMLQKANLLLLDEPTNHLDPETQKVIAENFKNYQGTIIMVSHNPTFIKNIDINRILLLPLGKIVNYSEEILTTYCNIKDK